jgi:hypothetical protein
MAALERRLHRGVTWLLVLAAVLAVALALAMLLSAREDPLPAHPPWPVVVRTVDGQATTVMPEDLDRVAAIDPARIRAACAQYAGLDLAGWAAICADAGYQQTTPTR